MDHNPSSHQRGQSMVLIALMFLAFIAMLALVLDGGLAYASRRQAQNAADAGALAGAAKLCESKDPVAAKAVAESYAIDHNGALTALATIDNTLNTVQVDASVLYTTTFARIFDIDTATAAASAKAACSPVCGSTSILPILWSCREPVVGDGSTSSDCAMKFGPQNIYIIMDNVEYEADVLCDSEPGGIIDCDFNDDGLNDIAPGKGGRSWLSADDETGTLFLLQRVIEGTQQPIITIHRWYSEQTGNVSPAYAAALQREGDTVSIPVFDIWCSKDSDPDTPCPPSPLPHPEDKNFADASTGSAWHIDSLAFFRITCVRSSASQDVYKCPGFTQYITENADLEYFDTNGELKSYFSIEGYFVQEYTPEALACNPGAPVDDVGNYTVTLLP